MNFSGIDRDKFIHSRNTHLLTGWEKLKLRSEKNDSHGKFVISKRGTQSFYINCNNLHVKWKYRIWKKKFKKETRRSYVLVIKIYAIGCYHTASTFKHSFWCLLVNEWAIRYEQNVSSMLFHGTKYWSLFTQFTLSSIHTNTHVTNSDHNDIHTKPLIT